MDCRKASLGPRISDSVIGWMVRTALRKQITAQQCSRLFVEEETAFPRVRKVRCVHPTDRTASQRKALAVAERSRRSVRHVVDAHHGGHLPTERNRLWSCSEKLVERSTLIRFEVGETDVSKLLDRVSLSRRLPPRSETDV